LPLLDPEEIYGHSIFSGLTRVACPFGVSIGQVLQEADSSGATKVFCRRFENLKSIA